MYAKVYSKLLVLSFLMVILLGGCRTNCTKTISYRALMPVYMSMTDMRKVNEAQSPKDLSDPGKICVYQDLLLIIEKYEGVHIFDNSDPANPVALKFVAIKGCLDMNVVDDVMFANQGADMVSWDISDPSNPSFVQRLEMIMNHELLKNDSFPIAMEERDIVEVIEDANCGDDGGFRGGFLFAEDASNSGGGGGQSGQAGSMSRFAYVDGYLYIVDSDNLRSLDMSDVRNAFVSGNQQITWEVETIFPYKDFLFLGTTTGMVVLNRVVNPKVPVWTTSFTHVRGCDPVVVYDDKAYVTLRGGSRCGAAEDALHIVDISKMEQPTLLESYLMEGPYGLAASDSLLLICDGNAGLKAFDRRFTFEMNNHQYSTFEGKNTYDVIHNGETTILSAKEGIFQIDYSDPASPVEISTILAR